jgi:hypothetical protein
MASDTPPTAPAGTPAVPPARRPGDPYCANCGYSLVNLQDSSKCPECGRPLVEVLARWGGASRKAKRYRSESTLFGVPIVCIALGARPEFGEVYGHAIGVIAIGDVARGGIAIGGRATGIVAVGGMALGVASMGGMSIGLLSAMGGMTIGAFAVGGFAIGGVATGGGAVGGVAQGGMAIGYYGRGGGVTAVHGLSARGGSAEAVKFFDAVSPVLGGGQVANSRGFMTQSAGVGFALVMACVLAVAVAAVLGHRSWVAKNSRGGAQGAVR